MGRYARHTSRLIGLRSQLLWVIVLVSILCNGAVADNFNNRYFIISHEGYADNEALEELASLHKQQGSAEVHWHLNRQWLESHDEGYKPPSFGRVLRKYLKRQLAPYIDSARLKMNTESDHNEYATPLQQQYQRQQKREFNTTYYDLDVKDDEVEFEIVYRF